MYTKKYFDKKTGQWQTMILTIEEEEQIYCNAEAKVRNQALWALDNAKEILHPIGYTEDLVLLASHLLDNYFKVVYSDAQQELDKKIVYAEEQPGSIKLFGGNK